MKRRKRRTHWKRRTKQGIKGMKRHAYSLLCGRLFHLVILVVCLSIIIPAFLYPPDKIVSKYVGFRWKLYCFFDDHYGLHSPFGALVRSFSYCARGQIGKAIDYYMLGPILLLFLIVQIPYRLWALFIFPKAVHKNARLVYGYFTALVFGLILLDWLFLVGGKTL